MHAKITMKISILTAILTLPSNKFIIMFINNALQQKKLTDTDALHEARVAMAKTHTKFTMHVFRNNVRDQVEEISIVFYIDVN